MLSKRLIRLQGQGPISSLFLTAVAKTAITDAEKYCLGREYRNYTITEVAESPHIRPMYDIVKQNDTERSSKAGDSGDSEDSESDPSCLVFEWMDTDWVSVQAHTMRSNPKLPKAVAKGVLSALKVIQLLNGIHTDISPNNVFLSDIEGPCPIAKLGDLGNSK
ncbi:hypothetical protein GQ44DRAFT_776068 [Phaeosphaeriaceae sp. PMI808]|nr:hypothetical protein GQ44DRAFT_776068 [Phaeosphaeriaceae sp. PMI808]